MERFTGAAVGVILATTGVEVTATWVGAAGVDDWQAASNPKVNAKIRN
jgi:hypothetical protein